MTNNIEIGTRALTEDEINNFFPQYNELLKEIDTLRQTNNININLSSNDFFSTTQYNNNISIIGNRGSGKTSIMKSIYKNLSNQNKDSLKYLITQCIVPEKLPDIISFISYFLGSLKTILDKIIEKEKQNNNFCFNNTSKIEKNYNELLEGFSYLQNKYQEIIVNTYTTTPNHIDITKKILVASNKFQEKFYNFINNIIIEYQKLNIDQENNSDDNNIILVNFIDDIDLNNNRCMEIIDLLLIYFSHPRIVNIISCDINTFKENISIEILKKEDLLYKEILDKNFLNPNNNFENILTRKNELSYEYLKKLLPPKYRFTLKNWSLKIALIFSVTIPKIKMKTI